MPGTALDEELIESLKDAKKSPRNFALVVKGVAPVKLVVQKKKLKEGALMKAKTEAKGNDVITGVLEASGSDFAFKVVGQEPSVKVTKLKEFIAEQTEMTVKPRWEVVNDLPKVADEEEESNEADQQESTNSPNADSDAAIPTAPPPPQAPGITANQLLAAMNKLSPQIQAAAKNNPDRKNDLVTLVAAFQKQVTAEPLDPARETLTQLVNLLKSLPQATAQPQPGNQPAKFSLVKLGKARIEWIGVRDKAVADIKRLKDALAEEFDSDPDQTEALAAALKRLDNVMKGLEVTLPDELDAILNAEETAREQLIATARKTLNSLNRLCNEDEVVAELDGNEVIEGFLVVEPMRAKLAEISAALGA
jgi:hypothetical protein